MYGMGMGVGYPYGMMGGYSPYMYSGMVCLPVLDCSWFS